jgi:cytosine/adenosine deaminase-related metal-dependent hydrolase
MNHATVKIAGARFIVTVDPERRIIQDGTIVIDGQRIRQIGKADELRDVTADEVIDAREMVITPGFCNNHMHISYAHATRGIFPDNLDPMVYLGHVFTLQGAMNEEDEYHTSLLGITELLKYGTTCFLDPGSTKFLDVCMQAYEESGCRIVLGQQVVDQPNPLHLPVYTRDEAVRRMQDTIQTYDHRLDDRVRAWAMPFDAAFCSDELLVAAKGLADQYATGMTLHQANRPGTVRMYAEQYGKRPVQYLDDLGILGPNMLLAHVIDLDDQEVAAIARTNTKTVMCPTAALKMGSRMTTTARLPELVRQGVCVSLGTDAGNNSNLLETMRSMYLVAVLYKDARGTTDVVPAELALELATIQGARALGLEHEIGSIEVGKKADLVLFDTRRPEWRTLFNPINTLVYNADGRSVHTVLVDGRVVVRNGRPCYVDEWELITKVQTLGEQLLERTGIHFAPRWPVV